jgi:hypothetical protein
VLVKNVDDGVSDLAGKCPGRGRREREGKAIDAHETLRRLTKTTRLILV